MLWLIGSLLYATVGIVALRLITGHFAYTFGANHAREFPTLYGHEAKHPSGGQWFGAFCVALCLAVIWPLTMVFAKVPTGRMAIGAEVKALQLARQTGDGSENWIFIFDEPPRSEQTRLALSRPILWDPGHDPRGTLRD